MFIILTIIFALISLISLFLLFSTKSKFKIKEHWYVNILDSIPFYISVTDKNRAWTFMNKPLADFLHTSRKSAIGKQCHEWKASICKTEKCGIECLSRGQGKTFFNEGDSKYQVDSKFLTDVKNNKIGHIEVIQDVSEFSKTIKKLNALTEQVETISRQVSEGASRVAQGSQSLLREAVEESNSVEKLSAYIQDTSVQIQNNAQNANLAKQLSEEAGEKLAIGTKQMQDMVKAMEDINNTSNQISNIIKTIDDIAFQTNILALNAAVEAARAGDVGKGFAVVADEVRNLASKSAVSAKNTSVLIESSLNSIKAGTEIANLTAESIAGVVEGTQKTIDIVEKISGASNNQSNSMIEISQGIEAIATSITNTRATAEESAASSEELYGQSQMLTDLLVENNLN